MDVDAGLPNLKICAVSYLNTVPLVWGLLHGRRRHSFELSFRLPSECADVVAAGCADLGILPSVEMHRQQAAWVPGVGIACRGPVRSILLVSKCPPSQIQTLAADSSSRTSVVLARIILAHRYGARPQIVQHAPNLDAMLRTADAALLIGDPALRLDPATLPNLVLDLGAEWVDMTGLPMVFAVWAGLKKAITPEVIDIFQESYRFGRDHLDDIIRQESAGRALPPELVEHYLTSNIRFELAEPELKGLDLFLQYSDSLTDSQGDRHLSTICDK